MISFRCCQADFTNSATAFDAGPGFVFNLGGGGPGIRVHQFGGARPRGRPRNPGQEEEQSIFSTVMSLLPIILLFIFPLLSSIFSGDSQPATPTMAFDRPYPPYYTMERTMPNFQTKYYVNPKDVSNYGQSKLHTLDKKAEIIFTNELRSKCESEQAHKRRLTEAAQGWFSQDEEKMAVANNYEMPSCRRLSGLPGVRF